MKCLGIAYRTLGNMRATLHCFQRSYQLRTELGDILGSAVTLNNVGIVHWRVGEAMEAQTGFEQAAEMFGVIGDQRGEAHAINNVGMAQDELGDIGGAAVRSYRTALAIRQDLNDEANEIQSHNNIASLYIRLGDLDVALNHI